MCNKQKKLPPQREYGSTPMGQIGANVIFSDPINLLVTKPSMN